MRLSRKLIPVTAEYHGDSFFIRRPDAEGKSRIAATPLFVVMLIVNTTDIIFATDSIPAIFAVTRDPFIVYTSNICAVLGLRAPFSARGRGRQVRHLKPASIILIFIGLKMPSSLST